MFCPNCGNEIQSGNVFCSTCGKKIAQTEKASAQSIKNRRTKLFITTVGVAIAVIVIVSTLIGGGLDLKYAWGTHRNEIEKEEILLGTFTHQFNDGTTNVVLTCEDLDREVDRLDELTNSPKTQYWVDNSGRLFRIYYDINESLSMTERLDILCDRYGDDYYVKKYGYKDARYYHYYWWVEDTVIELCSYGIDYYDESYYLDSPHLREQYDDLLNYFGKG